jgi:hypothetical protein
LAGSRNEAGNLCKAPFIRRERGEIGFQDSLGQHLQHVVAAAQQIGNGPEKDEGLIGLRPTRNGSLCIVSILAAGFGSERRSLRKQLRLIKLSNECRGKTDSEPVPMHRDPVRPIGCNPRVPLVLRQRLTMPEEPKKETPARFTCAFFLSVMAGTLALQAKAQTCGANAQSPIATDRPQITSSSVVVPCGSLQFENGFQETSNGGQRSFDFPETSVRFGIANKTELRFTVPNYVQNDDTATGFANGFGDLSVGLKQQLGPIRGAFDVSLIPSVSFPTGANSISSHGYDPAVQLPWSRSLSKNWTAAGMFSIMWPTEGPRRNLTGQSSVYFDRQLTQLWDAYAEYSGAIPQRGGPQHIIDIGAAYKITLHQQLDFHWNFGLSAATPDHAIGFGYSVRFQVIRTR